MYRKFSIYQCFAMMVISLLTSSSTWAQCEALTKEGVFDFQSMASDDQRVESFLNWARDKRSKTTNSVEGGKASGSFLDIFSAELGGDSSKSEQFWQDIENYSAGNTDQRNRLLKYAKTASSVIVDGFNTCIATKGLHVWIEMTSRTNTFRVAANFNSPGVPLTAEVLGISMTPIVKCDGAIKKGTTITGSTKRLTCTRVSCDAVSVALNADVEPIGGGTLDVPRSCKGGPTTPSDSLAQRINNGKSFTVTFDTLASNIGSIYPGRALTGFYSQGELAWRVSGPNGPGGVLVSGNNVGMYGCGSVVSQQKRDANCYKPTDHWLNLWGAVFSFTEQGEVKFKDTTVGRLSVAN